MAAKLTVIFYIILCLIAGFFLTVLPWWNPFGLSDWAENYFLVSFVQKTGLYGFQQAVSSGWVRGAVSGLGLLNIGLAVLEMFTFRRTLRELEAGARVPSENSYADENGKAVATTDLPDHKRRDDRPQPAVE